MRRYPQKMNRSAHSSSQRQPFYNHDRNMDALQHIGVYLSLRESAPKKNKLAQSANKEMATVFGSTRYSLYVNFLDQFNDDLEETRPVEKCFSTTMTKRIFRQHKALRPTKTETENQMMRSP